MYRWSADQVDATRRFDEWREVRSKGLFGVTAELEAEEREHFSGEFTLQKIGPAGLIELRASPYRVERSAQDIAGAPSDSLCVYQQLSLGGWFATRDSEDFTVERQAFATSYSDLPYRTMPAGADGFHLRIVKIPLAEIWPSRTGVHDLVPKPFDQQHPVAALLQSCFADLVSAGENIDAATAPVLVQALAHLALIERGVVRPGSSLARQALRVGRLSRAKRLIARNMSDVNLSPARLAGQLGISVRHLHALFETTGMSLAQTITLQRVEESRRLLTHAPDQSIASIAFTCGFESLATFYRAFHAACGMTPGDFRDQARR
jgi:AraC-like DNA-binding protein